MHTTHHHRRSIRLQGYDYPHIVLDAFVVMPNHLHGIIVITAQCPSAGAGVGAQSVGAHQRPITNDEASRIADTATRLLEAVGAPKQAQVARDVAQELLRLRFEAEPLLTPEESAAAQALMESWTMEDVVAQFGDAG
jgi:hypothetical protein